MARKKQPDDQAADAAAPTPEPSANGDGHPEIPPNLSAEALERIGRAERQLKDAESAMEIAKEKAKEAKSKAERLKTRLREVIREETGAVPNLFAAKNAEHGTNGDGQTPAADDDSWRAVRLDTLTIPPGTLKKLEEADIRTIGELTDWQDPAKNGGRENRLDQIKGIKGAAITRIDDALAAFWADWRERQNTPAGPVIEKDLETMLAAESEADAEAQAEAAPVA